MAEHEQAPQGVNDEQEEISSWELPDVGESLSSPETNVFGRKRPTYQAQQPNKPITPPTIAEIEQIREEAEQEGFLQGQEQGLAKGLEEGRLQGLEQGHAEGFDQGKEQGLAEGLAQAEQLMARFSQMLSQLEQPLALVDNQVEQSLLSVVQALAKSTLHHELSSHPELLLSAMRAGIDALPIKEQRVDIRLHPDDLALVEKLYGEEALTKNRWVLQKDPTLSLGSCIVECQRSQVDMQLETRINSVFNALDEQQQQLQQHEQQLQRNIEQANSEKLATPSETETEQAEVSDDEPSKPAAE